MPQEQLFGARLLRHRLGTILIATGMMTWVGGPK